MAIVLERPKKPEHGDFASQRRAAARQALKRKPREIAAALSPRCRVTGDVASAEIAGPGFINFTLKPRRTLSRSCAHPRRGRGFGRSDAAARRKVQVEFVSANPTGPLHVGHGRQAALGDAIAALLESQGYAVTREFYYNDAGAQIEKLACRCRRARAASGPAMPGWPEEGYAGEYIQDIARDTCLARTTPTIWRRSASSPSRICATNRTSTCRRSA